MLAKLGRKLLGIDTPNYEAMYAPVVKALEKSAKDIDKAVDKSLGIEKRHFEENKKSLMPAYKVTQGAIKELEAGSKSGRWNLRNLKLQEVQSFEKYLEAHGYGAEGPEVRTAFDHVASFKQKTRRTGKIDDPAYDFMARQMERSVQRRQAASGTRLSGAGAKELSTYMGNFANTKYAEAHGRAVTEGQLLEAGDTAAYNRVVGRHDLQRRNTIDNNQIAVDKWEAKRQAVVQDLAVVREKLNLGGVRDMVNLREQHSQNKQQTILTGATTMADLNIRAAETMAQGRIAQAEAEASADAAVLGTIGSVAGAVVGGPIGASIGKQIGSGVAGGGQTPSGRKLPSSMARLRQARAA